MDELVNPNWHVILIHYPLALLGVGIVIELLSFLWRQSGFRAAGRWMILIGGLACVPTVTSGLYAMRDAVAAQRTPWELTEERGETWEEAKASSPLQPKQWEHLENHVWLNALATVLFVLVIVIWLGSSDFWRRRLHFPLLALLVVGLGLISAGAWHGGEMVYRLGTAVEIDRSVQNQHHADEDSALAATTEPASMPVVPHGAAEHSHAQHSVNQTSPAWLNRVERAFPPMQIHAIMAGMVIAIAMAALGLSIRAITSSNEAYQRVAAAESAESTATTEDPTMLEIHAAFVAEPEKDDHLARALARRVPSSRFWVLAGFLAIITAGGGLWVAGTWAWPDVLELIQSSRRSMTHTILGTSIIVLTFLLAAITRWSPRSKFMLSLFSLLLILTVAGQIWMGVLLMYDTPAGGLTGFNEKENIVGER